ncbi:glycerol kinase GlpK [Buchananella hordeovulneris]|uniref:Glycerol kinase n=1 Tax=Buchananella hordeovulneris TaxID=52770 RepID=A0A1Q5PVJ3_9ACTO|nr:glycerol kinase GlpK [Buchananella hordeovulneris]OKL51455.1 glycerol kinase [Buchananella hordeovulneris]
MSQRRYVLAIDQGTTSSRAVVFNSAGEVISFGQTELRQHTPRPGWLEHDALDIWRDVRKVAGQALALAEVDAASIAAVGITNQRETAVIWERDTGKPIHPAIVWQDTRTSEIVRSLEKQEGTEHFVAVCGLPPATYFSGPKWAWILDQIPGARARAERGELLAGTIDSWLVWNLTGGPDGGVHITDVTNASRTLLMDLRTLTWRDDLCAALRVPRRMLPAIRPSSQLLGHVEAASLIAGVPIAGVLGDQQAAAFGQGCLTPGKAKNTYGTGSFLLLHTGEEVIRSQHGLLSTVAYQLGSQPAAYGLEGSIAVTGSLVQWLRDELGIITSAGQIEQLAGSVPDNGGVYIVPAFSGLFAPHWRADARGAILGLTRFATRAHLARAALEATAFQTREVVTAMQADSGVQLTELRVDGGMVVNNILMQFQADILGVDVVRPEVVETTSLGAAFAAGLAVGVWNDPTEITASWREARRWRPNMDSQVRQRHLRAWDKAVERSLGWAAD